MHMKLVIIVLNKTECLQELLEEFSERKLQGATVINSHGMMQELSEEDELRFVLSLRHILNPEHKENRTIFMAASESKVPIIIEAVNKKDEYRGLVYTTASSVVNLRGILGNKQSECLLPSANVDCIYHFDVTVGRVRFYHTAYNPESRKWDAEPAPGQTFARNMVAGESVDILVKAGSVEGRADRIRIVNREMKNEAVFTYKITAAPKQD